MTRVEIDLARKEAAKLAAEVLTAYEYGEGVADAINAIAKALRDAYDRGWSDGASAEAP